MPRTPALVLIALLGSACPYEPPEITCVPEQEIPYDDIDQDCDGADLTDVDGDGYDAKQVGGGDCNDQDKWIHPGMEEVCDEVDQDCDFEVDEDATDLQTWYADRDSDGWGVDDETYIACEYAVEWWWTDKGGDCNDDENRVAPGLDEHCDGVDEDCDGEVDEEPVDGALLHRDDDEDGWGADEGIISCPGEGWVVDGGDCDDADPDVNPDQVEICDDGVDQDCDGTPIGCGPWGEIDVQIHADARIEGENSSGGIGEFPAVIDADGDGTGDLLLGEASGSTAGLVYLIHGPIASTTYSAPTDAELVVDTELDGEGEIGGAQAGADLDGDGGDELLLGCYTCDDNGGAVLVVDASQTGTVSVEDVDIVLSAGSAGDQAGWDVAGVGDTNGDGYEDLLVGAKSVDETANNQGAAYLVRGPVTAAASLTEADAILMLDVNRAQVGTAVGYSADLDGDGGSELLVGALGLDLIYVVPAHLSGNVDLEALTTVVQGEDGTLGARGTFSARDLDGDGVDELLVGQPLEDYGTGYLFTGPMGSSGWALSDATSVFVGDRGQDLGEQVLLPGDLDANGLGEVALYAAGTWEVLLYLGPPPTTGSSSSADGILTSVHGASAPLGAGEVTDDGRVDLLVGITGDALLHEGHGL